MIDQIRRGPIHRSRESIYDPARDGKIEVEGNPEVIRALVQQAENVRNGKEDQDIRVALFILPGGIRGAYGGGQVTAIHEERLTDGIKVVVGGSTGAHIGAWLLAGNPRMGTTLYSEECTTPDFIRKKRLMDGHFMDVEYLNQIYRGEVGNKVLNTDTIKAARPDYFIAATDYMTGRGVLFDGKKEPILEKLKASAAAGPLYTEPVYIDGVRYGDASAGAYFPVKEILERYKPTHVLVLTNEPRGIDDPFSTVLADRVFSAMMLPPAYREAWLNRTKNYGASREMLRESGIPYLFIDPDNAIQSLTQDGAKIKAAAERAEEHMRLLIESQKTPPGKTH